MKKLISLPLFYTPVFISSEIYNINTSEFNFIKNLKRKSTQDNYVTENQNILELPELNNLKKWIQEHINAYFFEFLKIKDVDEVYITQSWSNLTKEGQQHPAHNHNNSMISGVIHLNDSDSNLNFYSYRKNFLLDFNYKEYTIYNSERWSWPTRKGNLFLFPSELRHGVDTQKIKRDRISLSFNTWVRGSVGKESSSTLLIIK